MHRPCSVAGTMKVMEVAMWIPVAALLFLGVIFLGQNHLLYFPSKATPEQLKVNGLRPWPSAEDFRGLIAEPNGAPRGTAIVFHGNAGHAGDRAFYAQALVPLGFRVVLAEYPGYGPRTGAVSEATLVADAEKTVMLGTLVENRT